MVELGSGDILGILSWKILAGSPKHHPITQTPPLKEPGTRVPLALSTVSRPHHTSLRSVSVPWLVYLSLLHGVISRVEILTGRGGKISKWGKHQILPRGDWGVVIREASVYSWFRPTHFMSNHLEKGAMGDPKGKKWVLLPRWWKKWLMKGGRHKLVRVTTFLSWNEVPECPKEGELTSNWSLIWNPGSAWWCGGR